MKSLYRFAFLAVLSASFLAADLPAYAFWQGGGAAQGQEEKKQDEKKEEQQEPKQDPKVEQYEKAIKDLTRVDGPFPLYQRKRELLLELSEERLDKPFCIQATFHTGVMADGVQAGFPVGDFAVQILRFERHEDNVWIVQPHLGHRWTPDDPLGVAASRSFPEAILGSFRIEQQHPEKKLLLVNVTNLFMGDVFRLSEMVAAILGGPYMLDREKSAADSIRAAGDSTIVRMGLHYASQRGNEPNPLLAALGLSLGDHLADSRSAPIKVSYNLWYRADSDYMPRLGDPRVGYFTLDYYDLARFANDDRTQRFIFRFGLKKKDPSAAMSEPVKPIVWYVDPSVPKEYREACREGILFWNRAFEGIGFKNAIVVKEPESLEEWDHADGVHNVLRFAMSEDATYAIALPRIDPITGEIISAGVNMDANLIWAAFREQDRFSIPGSKAVQRGLDVLLRDDERDLKESCETYLFEGPEVAAARARYESAAQRLGWHTTSCTYGKQKALSAAFGWNALMSSGVNMSREEYAKAFLRDIVSHEVGHTLGLRHNFIASTRLSVAELANDAITSERGVTASVMDYTPVNVPAILKGAKNLYAPRIGDYDMWAIKFGYMEIPGAHSPLGERHALSQIAAQSGMPGHRFMTDENADSFDPFVVRMDNSSNPLEFSELVLRAASNVVNFAVTQLPKPGESYAKRTEMILSALNRTFRECQNSARFVGGVAANRNFKGDANQKPTLAPVLATQQRDAMRLIARYGFKNDVLDLPADVLINLSQDFQQDTSSAWVAPLRDFVGSRQTLLYSMLMSSATTRRIAENEIKAGTSAYRLDEHFSLLLGAVFTEVGSGKGVSATRRDLQKFAINALMVQSGAAPGGVNEDVRALASDALSRLSARFGNAIRTGSNLDGLTMAHYRDSKATIDRHIARIATGR